MSEAIKLSLHANQVAQQAGAYPGFCSVSDYYKEYFYSPLDGMLPGC